MGRILLAIYAVLCIFTVSAHALAVQTGIAAKQVIQCEPDGNAALTLSGTTAAAGTVQARVVGVQKEILPWAGLGKAEGGAWQGSLAGVPAGGPYRIELKVIDAAGNALEAAAVDDVLVGDVWVLAGQSNMQGVGNRFDVEEPHALVHTYAMSYEWRLAQEPLHTLGESPDPVHGTHENEAARQAAIAGWRDGAKGAGLGLAFAKEMVKRTGRPVGLIASAHGGTSMAQWDPALKDKGGESLYGSMYKQVQAAGGKVRGVLWYQGESDANATAQAVYREKMKQLVAAMRTDFGVSDLPFYYVQISRFTPNPGENFSHWNAIQEDERLLEADLAPGGLVSGIDLGLDDGIHVGTPGLKTLGYRLAALAEHDFYGGASERGPRYESAELASTPYGQQLRVKFRSANGTLASAGRLNGFSISAGPDGADAQCIYNQEIAADDPSVIVLWIDKLPENAHLWYGRGLNPYCNLVDEANMAAPMMGPVAIAK
ncbi:MAG: hypothetical protein AMXMBFR84_26820 [Candidatus Hydrogenedentota bacterium]